MKNSAGYNGSKHSKTESSHAFTAKLGEWWRERGHRLKVSEAGEAARVARLMGCAVIARMGAGDVGVTLTAHKCVN